MDEEKIPTLVTDIGSPLDIVSRDGYQLQKYEEQTEELCLEAVKQNGWAIVHCKIKTDPVLKQAVKTTPRCAMYIDEKYHDNLLIHEPRIISVIEQTKERQFMAVDINPDTHSLIKKPTPDVLNHALQRMRELCFYGITDNTYYRIHELKHFIKTGKKIKNHPEIYTVGNF